MTYYAKTNTADPRTGFISVGEVLTDAQTDALGKDKLNELVERGVLGVSGGAEYSKPEQTIPPSSTESNISEDDKSDGVSEESDEDEESENAESEDDLPTLDVEAVITDKAPTKPVTKRGGRKAK